MTSTPAMSPRREKPMDVAASYATAILGGGPAGTGLLVCAARRGDLGRRLAEGVVLVERGQAAGAGQIGRYDLNSDSLATSFIECLENPSGRRELGALTELPSWQELVARRDRHVPLCEVADWLAHLGREVAGRLEGHPASTVHRRVAVRSISYEGDRRLRVELASRGGGEAVPRAIHAQTVVLALGGRQLLPAILEQSVAGVALRRYSDRVVLADSLLSQGGVERLVGQRPGGRGMRVVIVGGSHSAFSAAWLLVERGAMDLDEILILHRDRIRIFYPTPREADEDGYTDYTEEDICPRTGRVHRLGGLRGDGRRFWRRVTARLEAPAVRVRLERLEGGPGETDRVAQAFDGADAIVCATGFRARTVPVFDAGGRAVPLAADTGAPLVDREGRVIRPDGTAIDGLFGMGMGSGFLPPGEPGFSGQTNGVWLYHHVAGDTVLEAIDRHLARSGPA